MSIVYLNGEFMPQEQALISPTDRGFLFGDGIYEAIPFYGGTPFVLKPHLARLQSGLTFLRIKNFNQSEENLLKIFRTLLVKNKLDSTQRTMIYLQITRGGTPNRSHGFPTDPTVSPTVYAFCKEINFPSRDRWLKGYTTALIKDERWGRVNIKTINLLPNVLAFQDAKEKGADEAILYKDGIALEGSHTNLFVVLVQDGGSGNNETTTTRTLVTHPTTNEILPGITRAVVLEIAREQINDIVVEERPVLLEELHQAKEVFLTSTTSEIKPIVTIDGKAVQDGTVGETTRRLWQLFAARVESESGVTLLE